MKFAQLHIDKVLSVNKEDYEAYVDDEDNNAVDPDYGNDEDDEED